MERNLSYLSLVAVWVGSREDEDGVSRIVLSQKTRASYGPYLTLLPMIPPFYMNVGTENQMSIHAMACNEADIHEDF